MNNPARSGFVMLELIVAMSVLMVALSAGLMALAGAAAGQRAQQQRHAAREAVMLTLERLRALNPAVFPSSGQPKELGLPPHLSSRLAGAHCRLSISPETGGLLRAKVEVTWPGTTYGESGETVLPALPAPSAPPKPEAVP